MCVRVSSTAPERHHPISNVLWPLWLLCISVGFHVNGSVVIMFETQSYKKNNLSIVHKLVMDLRMTLTVRF